MVSIPEQESLQLRALKLLTPIKGTFGLSTLTLRVRLIRPDQSLHSVNTLGSAYMGSVLAGQICPYKQKNLYQKYFYLWNAIWGSNIFPK